jgi:hypothetical protein
MVIITGRVYTLRLDGLGKKAQTKAKKKDIGSHGLAG